MSALQPHKGPSLPEPVAEDVYHPSHLRSHPSRAFFSTNHFITGSDDSFHQRRPHSALTFIHTLSLLSGCYAWRSQVLNESPSGFKESHTPSNVRSLSQCVWATVWATLTLSGLPLQLSDFSWRSDGGALVKLPLLPAHKEIRVWNLISSMWRANATSVFDIWEQWLTQRVDLNHRLSRRTALVQKKKCVSIYIHLLGARNK